MELRELFQAIKRQAIETFGLSLVDSTGAVKAQIFTGTGSPEGVVGAAMGSLYLNLSGGVSTTLYVKTSAGSAGAAATGTFTGTTIVNGNTCTIAGVVYTFKTALTASGVANEILIGTGRVSVDNLIAAINGAAGEGTLYGRGTNPHPRVTAAAGAGQTATITARVAGADGNSIATTAVLSAGSWGAGTLGSGATANSTGWTAK